MIFKTELEIICILIVPELAYRDRITDARLIGTARTSSIAIALTMGSRLKINFNDVETKNAEVSQ